jgi:hypothetical protein
MTSRNRSLSPSLASVLLAAAALVACGADSASSSLDGASNPKAADAVPPIPNEGAGANKNEGTSPERAIAEADIVQLVQGRLYAMSRSGSLTIVDGSQSGRLTMLGQAYLPGEPFEMYVRGDLVFAMTNGAYAVDGQANEAPPSSRGTSTPASPATSRDPNAGAGVIVINVKDPGLMQRVATFAVPGELADSRIVGDVLYLATYENARCYRCGSEPRTMVTTFDLSAPSAIRQIDQATFAGGATGAGWSATSWKRSVHVTTERMYLGGHGDITPGGGLAALRGARRGRG